MFIMHRTITFSWLHSLCIENFVEHQIIAIKHTSFGAEYFTILRIISISVGQQITNFSSLSSLNWKNNAKTNIFHREMIQSLWIRLKTDNNSMFMKIIFSQQAELDDNNDTNNFCGGSTRFRITFDPTRYLFTLLNLKI